MHAQRLTCYMISVPSGWLVPQSNPNQSVMNMFGVPKYTINRASVTSLGPEKNTPKTLPARKKNPSQNRAKHLQTIQELTNTNTTQRHMSQANHPRQIPQRAHTGQTGQELSVF
jgi:hypothetical protein